VGHGLEVEPACSGVFAYDYLAFPVEAPPPKLVIIDCRSSVATTCSIRIGWVNKPRSIHIDEVLIALVGDLPVRDFWDYFSELSLDFPALGSHAGDLVVDSACSLSALISFRSTYLDKPRIIDGDKFGYLCASNDCIGDIGFYNIQCRWRCKKLPDGVGSGVEVVEPDFTRSATSSAAMQPAISSRSCERLHNEVVVGCGV
jgi:hypothetical protein